MVREEIEEYLYFAMSIGEKMLISGAKSDVWKTRYREFAMHMGQKRWTCFR